MTGADAAWLHMEDPTNLMMITGLFLFKKAPTRQAFKETIEERLLAYDRFRMKVTYPVIGRPVWKLDKHFNLDRHLDFRRLDPPGDHDQLMELVSQLMSTPLDRTLPLWQLHFVTGVNGEGAAIIARLHHAIADGIALMKVLLSLTDPGPESSGEDLLEAPRRKTAALVHQGKIEVKPRKLIDLARTGLNAATDLGKVVFEAEPMTALRGPLCSKKTAAFTEPLSLERIKEARLRAGCTVNDILMTALAGGLRRHLERLGKVPENVRVVVPVDLRKPEKEQSLGNRFGLVFLQLPVGLDSPLERLAEVRKRMDALKSSPQAVVVLGLLSAVGSIPAEMQQQVVELFGSRASAVVTNVPGPREKLYLAGERIDSLMFWVPQSGRLGLGVSILSYGGEVRIGVAADSGLTPNPGRLAADVEAAFAELLELV